MYLLRVKAHHLFNPRRRSEMDMTAKSTTGTCPTIFTWYITKTVVREHKRNLSYSQSSKSKMSNPSFQNELASAIALIKTELQERSDLQVDERVQALRKLDSERFTLELQKVTAAFIDNLEQKQTLCIVREPAPKIDFVVFVISVVVFGIVIVNLQDILQYLANNPIILKFGNSNMD